MASPAHNPLYRTAEHRAYRRYRTDLTATVWLDASEGHAPLRLDARTERSRTAYIENMSLSGLYFVCDGAYPSEAVVWLKLRVGGQTIQVKGLIRRAVTVQLTGRRCYGYGIQFVRSEETLQAVTIIAPYLDRLRVQFSAAPQTL